MLLNKVMDQPKVAILVPTFNEVGAIECVLRSIISQDYPQELLEIFFIDANSDDGTKEIILKYQDQHSNISVYRNRNKIVSSALNVGIKKAKAEILVRMDAHSSYESNYVSKCVEWLEKTGGDNVGGPMCVEGNGYVGKAIEFVHHSIFGLGGGKFHIENYEGYVDTVYLGAFRKEIFEKAGLFDESLVRNQDIEMNARIRKAGGKIYLTPEIRSTYYCRDNLKDLWKQNFANGYWNVKTVKQNPGALSWRHFIPFVFVSSLVSLGLSSFFSIYVFVLFLIDISLYLLVNILFSLAVSFRKGIKYFPILPIVFAALHLSYGLGSLWGVIKLPFDLLINRKGDC